MDRWDRGRSRPHPKRVGLCRRSSPAAEFDDAVECGLRKRHHRQAALTDQRDVLEGRFRFDLREGHRLGQRRDRFEFDCDPALLVRGRIRESSTRDFAEAHHGLGGDALIKEHAILRPHGFEMKAGGVVAHTGPGRATVAEQIGEGVGVRLGFNEPVLRCHAWWALVRCTEMEPSEAEKLKARRLQLLLYVLMGLMIGVPIVIYVVRSR